MTESGTGRPVFIGGINRSGTSMVRQILGSHPDLAIPPTEFEFFKRIDARALRSLSSDEAGRLVEAALEWPKVRDWGIDPELVRAYVVEAGSTVRGVFTAFLRAYAAKVGKPRYGEKTTYYERHLRLLDRWFGSSFTFVHVVRNPVSVYASTRWYGGVERVVDTRAWTGEWNESALTALQALRSRRGRPYVLVRYEDILADPESETRRICEAAGLEYEHRMLDMGDFAQKENSSFEIGGGAYMERIRVSDAVERATRVPVAELAIIRRHCRQAASLLGYDVEDERVVLPLPESPASWESMRRRTAMARSRFLAADRIRRRLRRVAALL